MRKTVRKWGQGEKTGKLKKIGCGGEGGGYDGKGNRRASIVSPQATLAELIRSFTVWVL